MSERDRIDLSLRRDDDPCGAPDGAAVERSLEAALHAMQRERAARRQRRATVAAACVASAAMAIAWWPGSTPAMQGLAGSTPRNAAAARRAGDGSPTIVRLDDDALLRQLADAGFAAALQCDGGTDARCELRLLGRDR